MITANDINKYFSYDKENGKLFWKDHWNESTKTRLIGKECGSIKLGPTGKKYLRVKISDGQYYVHQLVYFIETGLVDSKMHIDHIDGNGLNNKINNLRLVTHRKNQQNRHYHINKTKLVGASFREHAGRWVGKIAFKGRTLHLGYHDTELQAHEAYKKAHHKLLGIKI